MDLDESLLSVNNHWSTEVIIITLGVLIIALGAGYLIFNLAHLSLFIKILLLLPLVVVILYFGCLTPIRLELESDSIRIQKVLGCIEIPKHEIKSIKKISLASLEGSFRIFGSGGFLGYLGKFENSVIGKYDMYITERKRMILIETISMKYVVNCDREEEFMSLLKR